MPDSWKAKINASPDNLQEAMRRMKIQAENGGIANSSLYPDRPGEPDCIYYLKTGLCGYGNNCRFNHPSYPGQVAQYRGELPERDGLPDCQYFIKTGTCRFGTTCKYNHPRDKQNAGQIQLNVLGLPIRQEETSCPYYMRTGVCKYGFACKFNHPQPAAAVGYMPPVTGNSSFGSTGSSIAPPSLGLPYVGGLPAWSLPGTPFSSGPRMQGPQAYMPIILSSQGIMTAPQGWNTYSGTVNPVSSIIYATKHQGKLGINGQAHMLQTPAPQFPERPDQSECQYYMKTGTCKFGPTCKYHHPRERTAPLATSTLSSYGLPLRPGQAICTFYSLYGICKFGLSCKYDHPVTGFYNYNYGIPALSTPDTTFSYERITGSEENSHSKSSKSPSDLNEKTDASSIKHQNMEAEAYEEPKQEVVSPANTSTTSLELPQDESE